MTFIKQIYAKLLKNRIAVFFYFVLVSLPLLIYAFDAAYFSDDFQYVSLWSVYAKVVPFFDTLTQSVGGHYPGGDHIVPAYWLFHWLFTSISMNVKVFHIIIVLFFAMTAFVIFLIAEERYRDKALGLLAGTLFLVNYHIAFMSLNWPCYHFNVIGAFTGALSVLFYFKFINLKRKKYILLSLFFLVITIFNFETGFLFVPVLIVFAGFSFLSRKIKFKKLAILVLAIFIVFPLYFGSAYLKTGNFFPMSYRFKNVGKIVGEYALTNYVTFIRSPGMYTFNTNELLIRSSGFSQIYHTQIYNRLKQNKQLKKAVLSFIRRKNADLLKELPSSRVAKLVVILFLTATFFIFFIGSILKHIRKKTYSFLAVYAAVFISIIVIFNRLDVANSLAIFSSIIIADFIISLLRDSRRSKQIMAGCFLAIYALLTVMTIVDKFDDCYRSTFHGLSREAVTGPFKLYRAINKKIGHYSQNGIILFMHDYSQYHSTGGRERIGDLVGAGDFIGSHVREFKKEFLENSDLEELKNLSFNKFVAKVETEMRVKKIIVDSKQEALERIRREGIDVDKVDTLYISKNYEVTKFQK